MTRQTDGEWACETPGCGFRTYLETRATDHSVTCFDHRVKRARGPAEQALDKAELEEMLEEYAARVRTELAAEYADRIDDRAKARDRTFEMTGNGDALDQADGLREAADMIRNLAGLETPT